MQFAFSTPQTDRFFAARGASYHLLGFGYGESSRFPRALIPRYHPVPRLIIINADPFFQDVPSPAFAAIELDVRRARFDGIAKWLFDRLVPALCRVRFVCRETVPSTYRDRLTGQWIWHGVLAPRDAVAGPITELTASLDLMATLPAWVAEAKSFLADLGVPHQCVILTGVPTPAVAAEKIAIALGQRLGLAVVTPSLNGLTALDNSHLSALSVERWSASFFENASSIMDACLQPSNTTSVH